MTLSVNCCFTGFNVGDFFPLDRLMVGNFVMFNHILLHIVVCLMICSKQCGTPIFHLTI